jgi:hypothetical protein
LARAAFAGGFLVADDFAAGLSTGLVDFFGVASTTLPSAGFALEEAFFTVGLRARADGLLAESTVAVADERRAAAADTCSGRDELDDTNDLSTTGDQGDER